MRKSFRGRNQKIEGPKEFRINEKILSLRLMIIDETGANLGEMSKEQALTEAKNRELDLVEVSPKANPPIAKFIDYGSFKYQKEKQERKAKTKQKASETKTVKLTPRIGQHDMEIRAQQAVKFLSDGDKVKIEMQLRGRENQHADLAKENMKKLVQMVRDGLVAENKTEALKIESDITRQGGRLSMNIAI